jgi:hypothetical protein
MSARDLSNAIPGMIQRTESGQLRWTTADGASFESHREGQSIQLWREGKDYLVRHTMTSGYDATVRQRDFLWRCKLASLWDAVTPRARPAAAAAPEALSLVDRLLADEIAQPQWQVSGALRDLAEPLNERTWMMHLAGGQVCDEAVVGPYRLALLDVRGLGSAGDPVRYTYRLMVIRQATGIALLAANHEIFPTLGSASFGVHVGSMHMSCGKAPTEISLQAFRPRAFELVREQLLEAR